MRPEKKAEGVESYQPMPPKEQSVEKSQAALQPPKPSDLPKTSGIENAKVVGVNVNLPENIESPRVLKEVENMVRHQKGKLSVVSSSMTALHGIKNLDPDKLAELNLPQGIVRALFYRAGKGS